MQEWWYCIYLEWEKESSLERCPHRKRFYVCMYVCIYVCITHSMSSECVKPDMIFGVCISTNPSRVRWSLNRRHTPASTLNIAWLVVVCGEGGL